MTDTKKILAWEYARICVLEQVKRNPMTRCRNHETWETADSRDSLELIAEQLKLLQGCEECISAPSSCFNDRCQNCMRGKEDNWQSNATQEISKEPEA